MDVMASIGEEEEEIQITPISIPSPVETPFPVPSREMEPAQ